MQLSVEVESEGGWVPIGKLRHLPGVVGVGAARQEALAAVDEIALQLVEDGWIEDIRQGVEKLPVRIPIE